MTRPGSQMTIAALCRRAAARYPERIAIVHGAAQLDFSSFEARTRMLAAELALRVGPGDRVALLMRNSIAMVELLFAVGRLGAIAAPLNWRLAPSELAQVLEDAEPRLWVVSQSLSDLADQAARNLMRVTAPEGPAGDDLVPWPELFRRLPHTQAPDPTSGDDPSPDAAWIMLFTSGTTGRPKGCLLSQEGQYLSALGCLVEWRICPEDRVFTSLPMFHVAGLGVLLAHFVAGARTVMSPFQADGHAMLDLASEEGCTGLSLAPAQLLPLVEIQKAQPRPLTIRRVTMAGSMYSVAEVADVEQTFNARVLAGYGQTEAGNFVAFCDGEEQRSNPAAFGRALPHIETKVVGDDDQPSPAGDVGELCLRGPSVMIGYWRNAEASAAALGGGWLHTGDIVRQDAQGLLHFVGRKKHLVKSGGENVYPREVEVVLMAHEAIVDCHVFGVPDPQWGEAVKAAIVLAPGRTLAREAVTAWCRVHIAGYKRPRYIEFLDALPRNVLGKIIESELHARCVTAEQKVD